MIGKANTDIPEGLEFREEYRIDALRMYNAARQSQKRTRFGLRFLSVSILSAIAGYFFLDFGVDHSTLAKRIEVNNAIVGHQVVWGKAHRFIEETVTSIGKIEENELGNSKEDVSSSPYFSKKKKSNFSNEGDPNENLNQLSISSKSKNSIAKLSKTEPVLDRWIATDPVSNEKEGTFHQNSNTQGDLEMNPNFSQSGHSDKMEFSSLDLIGLKAELSEIPKNQTHFVKGTTKRALNISKYAPYISLGTAPFKDYSGNFSRAALDPYAAIGFDNNFRRKMAFGAELSYFSISGNTNVYSSENTSYGQGYETALTKIHTNRLHYIGFTPSFRYRFKDRHQFNLGYSLTYLIQGKNEIQTEVSKDFGTSSITTTAANGYILGFNRLNHDISLGYCYWLGRGKAIGMNYHLGLTDISRASIFDTNTMDRNSRINFYFKINLR